jgi:hypothetical protein
LEAARPFRRKLRAPGGALGSIINERRCFVSASAARRLEDHACRMAQTA